MELIIKTNLCDKPHFAQCNNASCKSIFPVDVKESIGIYGHLCPRCLGLIEQNFQVIQCSSCKTIIQIAPPILKDEKASFLVEKCTNCTGTEEDETLIEPVYNYESLI